LSNNVNEAARAYFSEVREGTFPDEDHSFRSTTMRLVSTNADVQSSERDEKAPGVYGVPV
ncbi:MAG TPA: 3-methyl-2-oxobutanoate hydroxymethyltransferase, partial [Archangium sp.]